MTIKQPTFNDLADYCRKLYAAAQALADTFERHVDHYRFTGGMNDVEDLIEVLELGKIKDPLPAVIYPDLGEDDEG